MSKEVKNIKKIELKDIEDLLKIPEVNTFLYRAVEEAREKFKEIINQHRVSEKEWLGETDGGIPSFKNGWSKKKSYFFELKRVKDKAGEPGYRWDLGRFRLTKRVDMVRTILSRFIQKVDEYPIIPDEQQHVHIDLSKPAQSFHITFMKNREDRVTGFVKEIPKEEKKVEVKDTQVIKLSSKYQDMDKQEMYDRIFRLMEERPEIREDIFFYIEMMVKSHKRSLTKNSKD